MRTDDRILIQTINSMLCMIDRMNKSVCAAHLPSKMHIPYIYWFRYFNLSEWSVELNLIFETKELHVAVVWIHFEEDACSLNSLPAFVSGFPCDIPDGNYHGGLNTRLYTPYQADIISESHLKSQTRAMIEFFQTGIIMIIPSYHIARHDCSWKVVLKCFQEQRNIYKKSLIKHSRVLNEPWHVNTVCLWRYWRVNWPVVGRQSAFDLDKLTYPFQVIVLTTFLPFKYLLISSEIVHHQSVKC